MSDKKNRDLALAAERLKGLSNELAGLGIEKVTYEQVEQQYGNRVSCNALGLFDATGSMEPLWQNTRDRLQQIVERLVRLDVDFRFQWIAYRDYSEGDRIIEKSGWSSEAQPLQRFLDQVSCFGGYGEQYPDLEEAVERGLSEAAADEEADVVLLIGDEPPHRERDWHQQAERLAQLQRRVHCFVVGRGRHTFKVFSEIAKITGGTCNYLDDFDALIDVIVMSVLAEAGEGSEARLNAYEQTFRLSHEGKKLKQDLLRLQKL